MNSHMGLCAGVTCAFIPSESPTGDSEEGKNQFSAFSYLIVIMPAWLLRSDGPARLRHADGPARMMCSVGPAKIYHDYGDEAQYHD